LRSVAHELVHHVQNERGEFNRDFDASPGYALRDDHLWGLEQEAYKDGNSCFRRWEDTYKQENQLEEQKMITIKKKVLVKMLKESEQIRLDNEIKKLMLEIQTEDNQLTEEQIKLLKEYGLDELWGDVKDVGWGAINAVGQAATGAAVGGAAGAAGGSFVVPVVGTALGAAGGATLGAVGGFLKALAYDDENKAKELWNSMTGEEKKQAVAITKKAKDTKAKKGSPAGSTEQGTRRKRSKIYARGRTVGLIQGELLRIYGVTQQQQESRVLSEANIRDVLGSNKIDRKLGDTTWKSLLGVPAVKKYIETEGATVADARRHLQNILKVLKGVEAKAGGPTGSTPEQADPAGDPAPKERMTTLEIKDAIIKGTQGSSDQVAAAAKDPNVTLGFANFLAKQCQEKPSWCKTSEQIEKYVRKTLFNKGAKAFKQYRKYQSYELELAPEEQAATISSLEESKSPLKQVQMKHYQNRNKKLFEYLIKKVK